MDGCEVDGVFQDQRRLCHFLVDDELEGLRGDVWEQGAVDLQGNAGASVARPDGARGGLVEVEERGRSVERGELVEDRGGGEVEDDELPGVWRVEGEGGFLLGVARVFARVEDEGNLSFFRVVL